MRTASHFTSEDIDFLITFFKMQFPHSIRLKNLEELLELKKQPDFSLLYVLLYNTVLKMLALVKKESS